jgi:hypothetical protein
MREKRGEDAKLVDSRNYINFNHFQEFFAKMTGIPFSRVSVLQQIVVSTSVFRQYSGGWT